MPPTTKTSLTQKRSEQTPNNTANLGWLYNKHYFTKIGTNKDANRKTVLQENRNLLARPLPDADGLWLLADNNEPPSFGFRLKTTYPGLVTGIGAKHETGKAEGELKLGCAFDHTTGIPYVAGSGVKGRLRSFFAHPTYLLELLNEQGELKSQLHLSRSLALEDLVILEKNLFEGLDAKGQRLGPYRTDTFWDAFAVATEPMPERKGFLVQDSITHHPHPLKNPNPIQFLVVGPGVLFQFAFRLFPLTLTDGLVFDAEAKCTLFRYLLREHGVGAKTNVGYGQFTEP